MDKADKTESFGVTIFTSAIASRHGVFQGGSAGLQSDGSTPWFAGYLAFCDYAREHFANTNTEGLAKENMRGFSAVRYLDNTRRKANAREVFGVVYDFDHLTQEQFDRLTGWKVGAPYESLKWETTSSTKQNPRLKIFFPFDSGLLVGEEPHVWPYFWRMMADAIFGEEYAALLDPSGSDITRFTILPHNVTPDGHVPFRSLRLTEVRSTNPRQNAFINPHGVWIRAAARRFDEVVRLRRPKPRLSAANIDNIPDGVQPGDWYNQAVTQDELLAVLERQGWRVDHTEGDKVYLTRPGKDCGVSAVLGGDTPTSFYNWSSSVPGMPVGHSTPFFVLAWADHGGDLSAAARHLRGASSPAPTRRPTEAPGADAAETGETPELKRLNGGNSTPPQSDPAPAPPSDDRLFLNCVYRIPPDRRRERQDAFDSRPGFADADCAQSWAEAKSHFTVYGAYPPGLTADSSLDEIAGEPENWRYWLGRIQHRATRAAVSESASLLSAAATREDGGGLYAEVTRIADRLRGAVASAGGYFERLDVDQVVDAAGVGHVPTGWHSLDKVLGGGLAIGRITIVAADPGVGKSAFARQVAYSAAKKHDLRVALVSLEWPTQTVVRLMLVQQTAEPLRLIETKLRSRDENTMAALADIHKNMWFSDRATTAEELCRGLAGEGFDLVVIDLVDNLVIQRGNTPYTQSALDMTLLQQFFLGTECACLCVSHTTRDTDADDIRRLSNSATKERHSSAVIFLTRDMQSPGTESKGEVRVVKNNLGPTGTITATFEKDTMWWDLR